MDKINKHKKYKQAQQLLLFSLINHININNYKKLQSIV